MNRSVIKSIAEFGPILIFFTIYLSNNNDLKLAIPPFIIATLIALAVIYFLEKKIAMVPLISGVLIGFFGGLTLYFDNKV
ncbi:MAG: intracellular septation protein A, partial [Alphaproteobacteria bacterium]